VNGFDVVECSCGLVRTVLPPGFDPASIYTEAYFQGGHRDGYADYSASGEELAHEFRRILAALKKHVPGGRLVEIGCAYGYFLDAALSSFEICGVEISDHARAVCVGRGLDVGAELTPEFAVSRGPFDAAVMLDVLEHMQDPGDTLDLMHANMSPGAQLMITTGDFGSLLARTMGKRWRLMTPPQHLWFFSPATITALLARHGFRVHTVEHPWKMVPVALAAYQASRYLGGQAFVRRYVRGGRFPINLFDAMRVIAERVERPHDGDLARYELAAKHARGRVLEIECGEGRGTRWLADHATSVTETVGLDRSPAAIRIATDRHARPGVRFARGDATTAGDGYDTIISIDTLEHCDDPEATVVRLIAALRDKGVLVAEASPSIRTMIERYGMRAIDQLVRDSRVAVAWERSPGAG
jgi:2-polyprenyl-3-methyl-5-hydroxy-6-metoxy-1,4-benzoquinol methylase